LGQVACCCEHGNERWSSRKCFIWWALLYGVGWLEVTLPSINGRHWFLFSPDKISLYPTSVRCNVMVPPTPSYTYFFSYFYYICVIHFLVVLRIFCGQYRIFRQWDCFSTNDAKVRFCRTHFPLRALFPKMLVWKARLFPALLN
jgi:hypothetical protein